MGPHESIGNSEVQPIFCGSMQQKRYVSSIIIEIPALEKDVTMFASIAADRSEFMTLDM
jgi:hypothetical protein